MTMLNGCQLILDKIRGKIVDKNNYPLCYLPLLSKKIKISPLSQIDIDVDIDVDSDVEFDIDIDMDSDSDSDFDSDSDSDSDSDCDSKCNL